MKIALVSPYDYAYPGGVTQHIMNLEEQFARLGHTVKIITPSSVQREALARDNVITIGKPTSIPANGSVARITVSLRLSGRVKRVLEHEAFDVVHLHEPLMPALPITVLRHSNSINIGTFHAFSGTGLGYFYGKPILKRWFARLDGRIAVSQAAYAFVSRFLPGKYAIIPNGINVDRFAGAEPFPHLRDGRRNVFFLGRLEKRKGFDYLLKAFPQIKAAVPDARLLVVGAYDADTRAEYEARVAKRGLTDVHFLGWATEEDKARYFRSADVFCAPSTGGESFGIVLLEAMAAGTPVVASDIVGYRTVLEHGQEGVFVVPKDPESIAEGVIELLRDPELRREMGRRGQWKARQYDWPIIARRVLDYYEAVRHTCGLASIASPQRVPPLSVATAEPYPPGTPRPFEDLPFADPAGGAPLPGLTPGTSAGDD